MTLVIGRLLLGDVSAFAEDEVKGKAEVSAADAADGTDEAAAAAAATGAGDDDDDEA